MLRQHRADADDVHEILGLNDRSNLRQLTCLSCARGGKTSVFGLVRAAPGGVTVLARERPRHRLGAALRRLRLKKRSRLAVTPLPAILSCHRGHARLVSARTLGRMVESSPNRYPVYL